MLLCGGIRVEGIIWGVGWTRDGIWRADKGREGFQPIFRVGAAWQVHETGLRIVALGNYYDPRTRE